MWVEFKGIDQGTATAFGSLQSVDECTRSPATFFKPNAASLRSKSRLACSALLHNQRIYFTLPPPTRVSHSPPCSSWPTLVVHQHRLPPPGHLAVLSCALSSA